MLKSFVFQHLAVLGRVYRIQRYFTFCITVNTPAISFAERRGAQAGLSFREKGCPGGRLFQAIDIVFDGEHLEQDIVGSEFVWIVGNEVELVIGDCFTIAFLWRHFADPHGAVVCNFNKGIMVVGGMDSVFHGFNGKDTS